jgi:hypothetical protein
LFSSAIVLSPFSRVLRLSFTNRSWLPSGPWA